MTESIICIGFWLCIISSIYTNFLLHRICRKVPLSKLWDVVYVNTVSDLGVHDTFLHMFWCKVWSVLTLVGVFTVFWVYYGK